jgi:HNH endonuclease
MSEVQPAMTPLDPRKVYLPVQRCIYCEKLPAETVLTKEHVIPCSLGGTVILPKSSCTICAAVTGKLERQIAKAMWDYTRVQHGLPSRRPEKRPQHFEMETTDGAKRDIPVSDLPPVIISFAFRPAGILLGLPPCDKPHDVELRLYYLAAAKRGFSEIRQRHGDGRISLNSGEFDPISFARFLAKVAHAFAVGELGADGFRPMLRQLILGRQSQFAFHYIGGGTGDEPPSTRLHELSIGRRKQVLSVGETAQDLLVVRLRFFARYGLPAYYAVVGEPSK